jgi:hypothetical protein
MNNNFIYNNVVDNLNNIFLDFENTIKNDVENNLKIKTRCRETSFINAM